MKDMSLQYSNQSLESESGSSQDRKRVLFFRALLLEADIFYEVILGDNNMRTS